ncbi:hypothetical protein HID58_095885, partial [Brassica napus]
MTLSPPHSSSPVKFLYELLRDSSCPFRPKPKTHITKRNLPQAWKSKTKELKLRMAPQEDAMQKQSSNNNSDFASKPCLINGPNGHVYTYSDVHVASRRIAAGKASNSKLIVTSLATSTKSKTLQNDGVIIVCTDEEPSPIPEGCLRFTELTQSTEIETVEISSDDVVALPYSSGTTGLPKGVMLTHRGLVTSVAQQVDGDNPNLYFHSDDVILCVLPVPYLRFESIMLCGLRVVTVLRWFPPIVLAMAKSPETEKYDLSSIRVVKSGAAPLGKELEDAVSAKFPNAKLGQGYGMTEAGPVLAMSLGFAKEPFPVKSGACGFQVAPAELEALLIGHQDITGRGRCR